MAGLIQVRALAPQDEAEWRNLWHAYLAFYGSELPEDVYQTYFQRLIGGDPRDFQGFVAEGEDGQLLGLTHFLFHRHGWHIEDVVYLQDLYVVADARGLGVGRKLIEAVYAEADAKGAAQVYWLTQHFNKEARMLYDRVATETPFIKYQRA